MIHRVDAAVKVSRVRGSRVEKIADLKFGCEGTDALGALVATLQHVDGAPSSERLQRMEGDRRLGELFRRGNRIRERLVRLSALVEAQMQQLCQAIVEAGGLSHPRCHWDFPEQPDRWHHLELNVVPKDWAGGFHHDGEHRVVEPTLEAHGTDLWRRQRRYERLWHRRQRVRSILERALDASLLSGL